MDCICNVEQRRLTPGVFNLKQYLNNTETMVWNLTSHYTDGGECDLCDYDAYLVLSVGGKIDEILLTKTMIDTDGDSVEDTLRLTWSVGEYATELTGYTKYQIIFRSSTIGNLGVIGSTDTDANGTYSIFNSSAIGNNRKWTNDSSSYVIKWDSTNSRWTLYEDDETTVVHYQTFSQIEPFCGTWNGIVVGNTSSNAWYSDEAIMFISDTVAADQSITANFPTVLRQVWEAINSLILNSGLTAIEGSFLPTDWTVDGDNYYIDVESIATIITTLGNNVIIKDVTVYRTNGVNFDEIINVDSQLTVNGMRVVSKEQFSGKFVVTLQGTQGE